MFKKSSLILAGLLIFASALSATVAAPLELHGYLFPERERVTVNFIQRPAAPAADLRADITYRKGQAQIDLWFESMKPAILYGGDVTCYVLWAVTRDGEAENLGELVTRKSSGKIEFSTGKKSFALMVTAEPYYLVGQPSDLVVFNNTPSYDDSQPTTAFNYDKLVPAAEHGMDTIANIRWDSKIPLELLQARKAHELAGRHGATEHAGQIHAEAGDALTTANDIALRTPRSRELLDAARRSVALSNEALNITMRRVEGMESERRLAARLAETEALERRAAEAEVTAEQARVMAEEVRREADRVRAETAGLTAEKVELETTMTGLRREKAALEMEAELLKQEKVSLAEMSEKLKQEKSQLDNRLQAALSHVAETKDSVRGFVVNLPDILFDVNEATLKPEAQLALSKMAGILLIMPDQNVRIEGHTDATGDREYNLELSQRRATAVLELLSNQGVDGGRIQAVGFGLEHPVAENDTMEGRRKNRRVEIVINEDPTAFAAK